MYPIISYNIIPYHIISHHSTLGLPYWNSYEINTPRSVFQLLMNVHCVSFYRRTQTNDQSKIARRIMTARKMNNVRQMLTEIMNGRLQLTVTSLLMSRTPNPVYHVHHDDVMKWKHFPRYWPFVRGIHRSPVPGEFPAKRPVTGYFDVSLICVWINGWINNREAGDLRRHHAHYDVIVTYSSSSQDGAMGN